MLQISKFRFVALYNIQVFTFDKAIVIKYFSNLFSGMTIILTSLNTVEYKLYLFKIKLVLLNFNLLYYYIFKFYCTEYCGHFETGHRANW